MPLNKETKLNPKSLTFRTVLKNPVGSLKVEVEVMTDLIGFYLIWRTNSLEISLPANWWIDF